MALPGTYQITGIGKKLYRHYFVDDNLTTSSTPYVPLAGSILGLWRRKAWRRYDFRNTQHLDLTEADSPMFDMPSDVYERMTPALRLATILMNRVRPLAMHVLSGSLLKQDGGMAFDPSWRPTQEHVLIFDQALLEMESKLRMFEEIGNTGRGFISGSTRLNFDKTWVHGGKCSEPFFPQIAIATEVMNPFYDAAWYQRPLEHREAVLAGLALFLVHEFFHCLWYYRLIKTRNQNPGFKDRDYGDWTFPPEPVVLPATFSELGHAAIHYLFGFEPAIAPDALQSKQSIFTMNGTQGLLAFFHAQTNYRSSSAELKISPQTLHSWFNEYTWLAQGYQNNNPVVDVLFLRDVVPGCKGPEGTPENWPRSTWILAYLRNNARALHANIHSQSRAPPPNRIFKDQEYYYPASLKLTR